MEKEHYLIDIEIIWKYIHECASEEETQFLENWIAEDEKHKTYYENAVSFFKNGSSLNYTPEKLGAAWKSLQQKHKRSKKWISRVGSIAAAAIASALIITALLYQNNSYKEKQLAYQQARMIKSGTHKAKLILNDGQTFNLTSENNFKFERNGALINNSGNQLQYKNTGKKEKSVQHDMVSVPRGGEYTLLLSDGTKVRLNSESSVRYPVRFMGDERVIELSGEAYLEVVKNKRKPFTVISGNQVVKVYGTSFNICCYDDEPVISTTLVEGKVEVCLKNDPSVKQVLEPNQQTNIVKGQNTITKKEVDPSQFIAWTTGRFAFQDENLYNIMKKLSKWYDVDVVFSSEEAKQIKFTGNLERSANFEEVLAKIEKTDEIKFKITGKQITIE